MQVEGYPLVNFLVVSLAYVVISWRLFLLTNLLKAAILPNKQAAYASHVVVVFGAGAAVYAVGTSLERMLR